MPAAPAVKPVEKPKRGLPTFSFIDGGYAKPKQDEDKSDSQAENNNGDQSGDFSSILSQNWSLVKEKLQKLGKIRQLAALSSPRFVENKLIVTLANKAIEQEITEQKQEISDIIYDILKIRVQIVTEVSENEIFIAKPVSDSQRLEAMMEHNKYVKSLCAELKLKL